MIKDLVIAVKYNNINLYPICVATSDELKSNSITYAVVKDLQDKGVDARVHVAQGTAFGYVFCKSEAFDDIAKMLPQDKQCCIGEKPVDKYMKHIIISSISRFR